MKIAIVTIFPEMFSALHSGIPGRAIQNKLVEFTLYNPRDYTSDPRRRVDDRPYGGGPGMVMMIEPLQKAIHAAKKAAGATSRVIALSPSGKKFDQAAAKALSQMESIIFVNGRYEGIDERLVQLEVDEAYSIGDYVISGGEFASMVIIDALTRLLPGALGDEQSAEQDSFVHGLLDHPHYTRPEDFQGLKVPKVLISGDHEAIKTWRMKESLGKTWQTRPDLIEIHPLSLKQQALLRHYIAEQEDDQPD